MVDVIVWCVVVAIIPGVQYSSATLDIDDTVENANLRYAVISSKYYNINSFKLKYIPALLLCVNVTNTP